MHFPNITIALATETDAALLASVMTRTFSASDSAYPLIWGAAGDSVHEAAAVQGRFTPVQEEYRRTFKAMDGLKLIGFATWKMPDPSAVAAAPTREEGEAIKIHETGLPEIPGVNLKLWDEKLYGPKRNRNVEASKDISLSLLFVLPEYQGRGIGSLLLQWGLNEADRLQAKTWVTSTPQAISTYEKAGWKIVQIYDINLGNYGGQGVYRRAWMVREPRSDSLSALNTF